MTPPQDALERVRRGLQDENGNPDDIGLAALSEIESYVRELERKTAGWMGQSDVAHARAERAEAEVRRLAAERFLALTRLREEIKRATENGRLAQQHWDRAERAEAEVRRLREALNLIASGEYYETAKELAAAALAAAALDDDAGELHLTQGQAKTIEKAAREEK